MDRKTIIAVLVAAVIFGATGFGGGMLLGRASGGGTGRAAMMRFAQGGGFTSQNGGAGARNFLRANMAVGKVTEKDANSFTVKMQDGSTRTVYYSSSTTFEKTSTGSAKDISVDTTVAAVGEATSSGDITAQRVQIGGLGAFGGGFRGMMGGGAGGKGSPQGLPAQ